MVVGRPVSTRRHWLTLALLVGAFLQHPAASAKGGPRSGTPTGRAAGESGCLRWGARGRASCWCSSRRASPTRSASTVRSVRSSPSDRGSVGWNTWRTVVFYAMLDPGQLSRAQAAGQLDPRITEAVAVRQLPCLVRASAPVAHGRGDRRLPAALARRSGPGWRVLVQSHGAPARPARVDGQRGAGERIGLAVSRSAQALPSHTSAHM
jgi:hypothetical protein